MTDQQRRAADKGTDIEALIAAEDDAKTRALLIILNSINNSMVANTAMTREVAEKLDQHLSNYEEHVMSEGVLVNKGLGAWKIAGWGMGAAQIVIVALVSTILSHFTLHDTQIAALQINDEKIIARVMACETESRKQ